MLYPNYKICSPFLVCYGKEIMITVIKTKTPACYPSYNYTVIAKAIIIDFSEWLFILTILENSPPPLVFG